MALIDRRIGILFIAFVALLAIALARATYLGSVKAGALERAAATQQVSNVIVPGPRGMITDRNGAELAISESADDIVADPYLVKNAVSDAAELSPALGIPQLTLIELLTKAHTGFVYLAHLVPASQAATVSEMNIAGISLIPETRRVYPRGEEAAQVVGTVYLDGDGSSGIEYGYNNVLEGDKRPAAGGQRCNRPADLDRRPSRRGAGQDDRADDRLWAAAGGRARARSGG